MRKRASGMLFVLAVLLVAAPASAAEKPSIDEAVKLLQDERAMHRDPNKRKRVLQAFENLTDEQKQEALRKLDPLLKTARMRSLNVMKNVYSRIGPASVSQLVRALADEQKSENAAEILPYLRRHAIGPVATLLEHPQPDVRLRALQVLERLAGHPFRQADAPEMKLAVPLIAKRLEDAAAAVRLAAASTLFAVGPNAEAALQPLLTALKAPETVMRATVARALGGIGAKAAPAARPLADLTKDKEETVRLAAVTALGEIGPLAAAASGAVGDVLLDSEQPARIRRAAARALAKIGKDSVGPHVPILLKALADEDHSVALTVGQALAGIGKPAVAPLADALKSDSARARRFAAFGLAKMGEDAAGATPALVAALSDKSEAVRANASEALGKAGAQKAVPALVKRLDDASDVVQVAAADALRTLAPKDPKVQAALQKHTRKIAAAGKVSPAPEWQYDVAEFEIGGPLAGVKLPLFPTQHGEPAGYPGAIPELAAKAAAEKKAEDPEWTAADHPFNAPFTPVGQNPERLLYPGAVEHWRAYMFKYMPVRGNFDRQSQLKNWTVPDLPGAEGARKEQYASPIYWVPRWGLSVRTEYKLKPVDVLRIKPGSTVLATDLGPLEPGVYALRIIAAVPTEDLRYFRLPAFVRLEVNDGIEGETSIYQKRIDYTNEFYSVAEVYFNAPAKRAYRVRLSLGAESRVDLLVRNVSLDDALAGTFRHPVKTRRTLHTPEQVTPAEPQQRRYHGDMLREERLARDAWLWHIFPRPNSQGNRPYRMRNTVKLGTPKMDAGEIRDRYGSWNTTAFYRGRGGQPFAWSVQNPDAFLVNQKLGLVYTIEDHQLDRPLPDPYPFKDTGAGLYYPDAKDPDSGHYWPPIGEALQVLYWYYPEAIHQNVKWWLQTGEEGFARDAAVALARWSYAFPTLDTPTTYINEVVARTGNVGRESRFRRRVTTSGFYRWYTQYHQIMYDYDQLYDYIVNNPDIARSVNRFVPWVKTPRDVIELIDVYLVQTTAKRILRYQYHTGEMKIAAIATLVGDTRITDPWMEWLFSRTFVYPLPVSGIADLMVTGCTREGTEYVASTAYAAGENALPKAAALEAYLRAGGSKKFDLSDPLRYPKPVSTCYWQIEKHLAGLHLLRIGDVCGPDKFYAQPFKTLETASRKGWEWTRDPRFAYILKHYFGRKAETEETWAAIEKAAKTVKRAPWLTQPSRAMPQWAAVLESGRRHDDFRFRRALMVRAGMGWGHHHNDGLDLQVFAHGLPMTCDGGQRPSYSRPPDRSTRMHNLVEVDGFRQGTGEWLGHNWIRALTDAQGAPYTMLQAQPPREWSHVDLYQRQVALIDVDEGKGSQPLTPAQCGPNPEGLPKDVVTANSYVFDVFRVAGGRRHTYAFHGNLSDEVKTNMLQPSPIDEAGEKDKVYLGKMAGERLAGDAPEYLQATWLIQRRQEQGNLRRMFDPQSPRKYTRLHVLGQKGARVLRGSLDCVKWGYQIPMTFVQRRGPNEEDADAPGNLQSVFTAVVEPYAGEPFITEISQIEVTPNENDARRATALNVITRNGHNDICFADGRPENVRRVGDVTVAAEFAYVSRDDNGIRQVTMTGGTQLQLPGLTLTTAARERTGKVVRVDYASKTLWIDEAWPAMPQGQSVFEIGTGNHWTCYTAVKVAPAEGGSEITVLRGADYYLARVRDVDPETNTVYCALGLSSKSSEPTAGIDKHWVATNEDMTKFWRAEYLGGNMATRRFGFKLDGKVSQDDFGRTAGFRLMEYGVGDTVRQSTWIALRRNEDGRFVLTGDVDVQVKIGDRPALKVTAEQLLSKPLIIDGR